MSECRWTYYDPSEGTQILGLYHGDRSGHVMIYLNGKVVLVDFQVFSSKSYSFIVNENLLKLNLQKHNGKFQYEFEGYPVEPPLGTFDKMKSFLRESFSFLF